MGRKRGEIEDWLKRIMWSGRRSDYIIYIRYRRPNGVEELRPIDGDEIVDVRRGYIILWDSMIPYHRVEEIRLKNGKIVFKRR